MTNKQNTMIAPGVENTLQHSVSIMKSKSKHPSNGKTYKFSKFWDRIANRYAKKAVPDEQAYQKKLEVTREYLRDDMQVLEIGCGTGTTALLQAPYVKHIYATDFSASMIEIANEKAQSQKVNNVTFEQKSIDELPMANEFYDVVMGHSILHLLDNTDDVIAKVHKSLKPNGVFVRSTACIAEKMGFFRYIAPVGRFLRVLPMINVFTIKQLEASLDEAGFQREYQSLSSDGIVAFIVARKLK